MMEHVYPEISMKDDKCNICDSNCHFNIIENQIDNQQRITPKSGR